MTVLLTGSGGFLGSRLRLHYECIGVRVLTVSFRPERRADFFEEAARLLADERPAAVINCGACQAGGDDPATLSDLLASNVHCPAGLASLIVQHSPATALVTFGTHWQTPLPFNAYAASKSACEPFLDHFAQSGLRCATLRLSDVYGPGDPRRKLVNLF
jgi:nucleoside-diphosphate-sugar epimerase